MSRRNNARMVKTRRQGVGQVRILLVFLGIVALAWALVYAVLSWQLGVKSTHTEWHQEALKLYAGFETFREKFGAFPPSFDDKERLAEFVKQAFPEYQPGVSTPYPESLDAAEAVVFWLTRISTDPKDPFGPETNDPDSCFVFYTFAESRVRNGRYYPHPADEMPPFVYLPSTDYDTAEYDGFRPYVRSRENGKDVYFAPESCQIVVAGRDGKLGRGGMISEITEEDRDNLTSFSTQLVGDIDPDE